MKNKVIKNGYKTLSINHTTTKTQHLHERHSIVTGKQYHHRNNTATTLAAALSPKPQRQHQNKTTTTIPHCLKTKPPQKQHFCIATSTKPKLNCCPVMPCPATTQSLQQYCCNITPLLQLYLQNSATTTTLLLQHHHNAAHTSSKKSPKLLQCYTVQPTTRLLPFLHNTTTKITMLQGHPSTATLSPKQYHNHNHNTLIITGNL